MLTSLRIRRFKRFRDADIELGNAVVFIGPNNSGKTTALQALALWDIGLRRWNEKRGGAPSPEKRPGVTINRKDLISIPIPDANLLWRDLHVRDTRREIDEGKPRQRTENVRIDIIVDGITADVAWSCGLEFDFANDESFYCRPLRLGNGAKPTRMDVPEAAGQVRVAYLPPMSGLSAVEPKWEPGRINVLIGEGQTAQVLRNLCYQIYSQADPPPVEWVRLTAQLESLFGVKLLDPRYISERGEITMEYQERRITLDISSAGRGLQQTLLLLAHLYANPRTVLLLDEPDAHLEIIRQRQIYDLLTRVAGEQGSQIVCASHSEVVLNEAANRNVVVAFVGAPHRINASAQVLKSLRDIGFDQYYQAEQIGWVLYLESASDLANLKTLAHKLNHRAAGLLERPFVHYVGNAPQRARDHFYGLREAKPDLVAVAIFDHLDRPLGPNPQLVELMWRKAELENYFCSEATLMAYADYALADDLFGQAQREVRRQAMRQSISEVTDALATLGKPGPWSNNVKASDEVIARVLRLYYQKLGLPFELGTKSDYHLLATFLMPEAIDPEISEKLDEVVRVAEMAKPAGE